MLQFDQQVVVGLSVCSIHGAYTFEFLQRGLQSPLKLIDLLVRAVILSRQLIRYEFKLLASLL